VHYLDNFFSGIPNAIASQSSAGKRKSLQARTRVCDPRECQLGETAQIALSTAAGVADKLETYVKEEADVEFQRCGPQDT
jgi:hypothetical protein